MALFVVNPSSQFHRVMVSMGSSFYDWGARAPRLRGLIRRPTWRGLVHERRGNQQGPCRAPWYDIISWCRLAAVLLSPDGFGPIQEGSGFVPRPPLSRALSSSGPPRRARPMESAFGDSRSGWYAAHSGDPGVHPHRAGGVRPDRVGPSFDALAPLIGSVVLPFALSFWALSLRCLLLHD